MANSTISEATRRDISDLILIENIAWSGRLEEPEFLSRLYNLKEMPSTDHRYENAYGDIWQHRVNNDDWSDDWVFTDSRFDLMHTEADIFLRFLCETLHPVVRTSQEDIEKLKQAYNLLLANDGYEIVPKTKVGNRELYAARQIALSAELNIASLKKEFLAADASYVNAQITRMESAVDNDPGLAIGTAKELVETVCKTILEERGITLDGNLELPKLVKQTAAELKLTPSDIPDEVKASDSIKRLLKNLADITYGVAELRNSYGTGHGKNAKSRGLSSRHAKLAVGAASTLAIFLVETHGER
ncbi:abortive infection family protein [Cellvibrio sp. OA-2007]|uniref:abortive infection family protein n=1 Tax=Cellvibrio sp. OA-2007 TaxID=529823 RepID=UPI0007839C50|nr:abortive infection family protein [Cellvibrio sp. OA-2007]